MRATRRKGGRLFFPILLLTVSLACAAAAQAERLPVKVYTTTDGLARNTINRIIPDSRSLIWFCTAEGLSRFDGYKFVNYGMDQGLPHRNVTDLLESRAGVYWIATAGGLCRLNPNGTAVPVSVRATGGDARDARSSSEALFIIYRPADPAAWHITSLLEDRAGTLWCGTTNGLYRLEQDEGQWALKQVEMGLPPEIHEGRHVSALCEDRAGTLWVGTLTAIYRRLPDGRAEPFVNLPAFPPQLQEPGGGVYVEGMMEDHEGRLWIATRLRGLWELNITRDSNKPFVARIYTIRDGLDNNWITKTFQSSDGTFWVCTIRGLSKLIFGPGGEARFRNYSIAHGISGGGVVSIAEDRYGNLWLGSDGAVKIAPIGFTTYNAADGIVGSAVISIFESNSGELCAISGQININRFDGERFHSTRVRLPGQVTNLGWGSHQIHLQDHLGEWWVATGEGLCRYGKVNSVEQLGRARPKAFYTPKEGLAKKVVFRIFEDSRGDIWIGTLDDVKSTLARWERATETFHHYSTEDGIPQAAPTSFCEDASGNLWIGFYTGGLLRYSKGRFVTVPVSEGAPPGLLLDLYLDRSNRLWVASNQWGVARIDDPAADRPQFKTYTTAEGLSSNQLYSITEDDWGRIYLVTGRGVDRLDPQGGQIKHYTSADGLPEQIVVAFRDRAGVLWFGGIKGLSRFIPEPDRQTPPPAVLISELRIAGVTQPLSVLGETEIADLKLEPDQRRIEIDFFGTSLAAGEVLRYQSKLEGEDQDWSAPTDQRTVNMSLAPGSYRFLVRAISADGAVSPSPATVSLTILRPLWQRWWFITLAVVFICFAFYAIDRYRVARLVELERVRTRIATDLHDDIGASLSRMAILSEVVKQQTAHDDGSANMLTEIADSARGLVDSMSDIVWAIDPRKDDLKQVVLRVRQFASDVLEARAIRWEFKVPTDIERVKLPPEHRRHLFLIFKEAINNIARHARCGNVFMTISVASGKLRAEIRDDGRGFAIASDSAAPTNGRGGNGLRNMQARAAELGGRLDIHSTQGSGTELALTVPLRESSLRKAKKEGA
jgi:ligand-binding sensor domain-containing protein/anti-sigma regulatory factor (Ser/Thr protein kinase)